ncbi:MAG TPA: hypothetical protein DCG57_05310 [Candidatus Riflebacteria bacterium]|nr:hypothetical protein [Candidatus Riflebacteria bacterium]
MSLTEKFKLLIISLLAVVSASTAAYSQDQFDCDQQNWNRLTTSEQEILLENLRFEMLHERKPDLQNTINELQSLRTERVALNSNNILKIPLRTGKLEVKALFKKARGEIICCTSEKVEAVLDTYRVTAVVDPNNPGKVLASFAGNDPNIPSAPISGSVKSDGKTARITAGADWIELTYTGNNSYSCRTNKVPVKITATFID